MIRTGLILCCSLLSIFLLQGEASSSVKQGNKCIDGNGIRGKEKRQISSFTSLETEGVFTITITSGVKTSLSITGDSNILPYVVTSVKGSVLKISSTNSICLQLPLVVTLTTPEIKKLIINGASDIQVEEINNSSMDISLQGASAMRLSGKTENLDVIISGTATLQAAELQAGVVRITANGTGYALIHPLHSLFATSNDVGEIEYIGDPAEINLQENDVGTVERRL